MSYIKKGGKHTGEPFYLKNSRNGNGNDQHYKGYNFEMRAPQIAAANELTSGYIINYNDSPIVAAYSSDSGGVTKSGCAALSLSYCGSDYAYLGGGVIDPENTIHDPAKIAASHGAGMSAVGAYQMAEDGSLWQEIIKPPLQSLPSLSTSSSMKSGFLTPTCLRPWRILPGIAPM